MNVVYLLDFLLDGTKNLDLYFLNWVMLTLTTTTSCLWPVIVDGSSSLLPKVRFVFRQFTSSPRDVASDEIVSSAGTRSWSSSARTARRHQQSQNLKMTVDQMTLHSCLCQQFFAAISPCPWQKSLVPAHTLGELQIQLWSKHSDWDARTQLTWPCMSAAFWWQQQLHRLHSDWQTCNRLHETAAELSLNIGSVESN